MGNSDYDWIFIKKKKALKKKLVRLLKILKDMCIQLRFEIRPKAGSKMLWRPNQLQFTGLRPTNIASFFMAQDLDACGTVKKAGVVKKNIFRS